MQAFYFDTVTSTNDLARAMIAEGKIQDAAYLVARGQTAGRGNRGRTWSSPRDAGIYLTVVDRPKVRDCGDLHAFTRAAAIACVEVLADKAKVPARIKPINDLFIDGRKLGGILSEAVIEQNRLCALITGVGINVRRADRPLPAGQVQPVCLEEIMPEARYQAMNVRGLTLALVERMRHWNTVVACGNLPSLEVKWQIMSIDHFACFPCCNDFRSQPDAH